MTGVDVEVTAEDIREAACREHPLLPGLRRCLPQAGVRVDRDLCAVRATLGGRETVLLPDGRLRHRLWTGDVVPGTYRLVEVGEDEVEDAETWLSRQAEPATADPRRQRDRERGRLWVAAKRTRLGLVKKGRPQRRQERLRRNRERVAKWRAGRKTSSG